MERGGEAAGKNLVQCQLEVGVGASLSLQFAAERNNSKLPSTR